MKYLLLALALCGPAAEAKTKKHKKPAAVKTVKKKAESVLAKTLPAHTKTRSTDLRVGDYVVVNNLYRPQYGCDGYVKKVLFRGSQTWYLVDIPKCDGKTFTTLSQLDRDELLVIK